MDVNKDIRLALAALLILFSVNPITFAISLISSAEHSGSLLDSHFTAALNLLGAAVGLAVAYWLFQRSRDTFGEDQEYEDVG